MCLATPLQVDKIDGDFAWVKDNGEKFKIATYLLKGLKSGDWIMAHDGLAISTLPKKEAKTILALIKDSHCHCSKN